MKYPSTRRPHFSVIIPVYNAAETIEETIASVRDQDDGDFELILVDDGSTDEGLLKMMRLAGRDERIRLVSQRNAGVSVARNVGVEMARGKLIAFCDADDLWHPKKLAWHRAIHAADPRLGASYAQIAFLEADHTARPRARTVSTVPNGDLTMRQIISENPVCTASNLVVNSKALIRVDVGPVITAEAQSTICAHIEAMRNAGHKVEQLDLPEEAARGTFVAPTIIEIDDIGQLGREVFGPVLHVMRYRRRNLAKVLQQINATGYGLTFGVHSRIDEAIAAITAQAKAGNIYVNRNIIGAIVGVQPFGGRGLSGTGPKAGGPLYLGRMVQGAADRAPAIGEVVELPGPVGERNLYSVHPRGRVLALPATEAGLTQQLSAVAATGNSIAIPASAKGLVADLDLPDGVDWVENWQDEPPFAHVLIEEAGEPVEPLLAAIAAKDGPIPIVQLGGADSPYRTDWMLEEVSMSIDTTAAGGNASLMAVA